jgi:hypothetical protein
MPISFTKYVDITSGVIAGQGVKARQLGVRIFTTNPLVPTNGYIEFPNANDVELYFGSGSIEYAMAAEYFAFISKTATSPSLISFAPWVEANSSPLIFGDPKTTDTLAQLIAITAGHINMTMDGVTQNVLVDFAGAANLSAVATIAQVAIRAASSDTQWATATVTYNATTGAFDLVGGAAVTTGTANVKVQAPTTGVDAGAALGWNSVATIFSPGMAAQTLTATMVASAGASDNFGSFEFVPTLNLTEGQFLELATWNSTQNVKFIFLVPVSTSNAAAVSAGLFNLPGCAITLSPNAGDYPELMPGMILGATDYSARNASQNYMYQQGNFDVTVSDDLDSADYDAIRVNYYGETQTAGQFIAFYQRGVLTGLATSPTDMNIYANEMWFKSAVGDALLALLLAVNQISTNPQGRASVVATIQSVIAQALFNGVISVGKTLNNAQIQAITSITGQPLAYLQVQTIGYWLDVEFASNVTTDGRTEYQATYTLIYSKNDAIRSVIGTHDLV